MRRAIATRSSTLSPPPFTAYRSRTRLVMDRLRLGRGAYSEARPASGAGSEVLGCGPS